MLDLDLHFVDLSGLGITLECIDGTMLALDGPIELLDLLLEP